MQNGDGLTFDLRFNAAYSGGTVYSNASMNFSTTSGTVALYASSASLGVTDQLVKKMTFYMTRQ
jgi:hypothetical protein